jgi:hypothetical protein
MKECPTCKGEGKVLEKHERKCALCPKVINLNNDAFWTTQGEGEDLPHYCEKCVDKSLKATRKHRNRNNNSN